MITIMITGKIQMMITIMITNAQKLVIDYNQLRLQW